LLEYCHKLAHGVAHGGQGKVIVGLNSDDSVRRLKGSNRPINNQYDRAYVLESLRYVDNVTIFDEDTPYELIKRIKPDVIVKGGDYTSESVIGNDIAEVKIFNLIEGKSTTSVISHEGFSHRG
jgi:D-beta-D-heptose 7-phosphate kinase/D-beta-D-heptose 1-phosphate adenosyltransferase